jgi:uncharacterized protein
MSQVRTSSSTISPEEVLKKYKVVAVVGASKTPEKEAYKVPLYLKQHGYRIIPINPTADTVLDEKSYPSLAELPADVGKQVELVNVFRPSEELPQVAQAVIEMHKKYGRPFVFWSQLGLENEEAKQLLSKNRIPYVMNTCARVVHRMISP